MQLLSPEEEQELVGLWPNRARSLQRVWELVTKTLRKTNPSLLRSLPDDKDEYIAAFFDQKVLGHLHKPQRLDRAASLCTWFNNFLNDQEGRKANQNESLDAMQGDGFQTTDADEDRLDFECGSDRPEDAAARNELISAARAFFAELEWQDRLYLSESHCPENGNPLSALAKRHRIASHHYRAGKLGIALKKGDLPINWEGTLIGRWIKHTLGIPIHPDALADIHLALKALCDVALTMMRGNEFPPEAV